MNVGSPMIGGRGGLSTPGRRRGPTALACLAWLLILLGLLTVTACQAAPPKVVVVELHGPVWPSTATFVAEQINAAWQAGATGVILDLDTTRGSAPAAAQIKTTVLAQASHFSSGIAAYVHDKALGPGSLIAIACKPLAMAPGGALGGADPGQSKADFRGAAEATGRNPDIAAAFISADTPLPALGLHPSESLTLTTKQAQANGYCDVVAADLPDVLAKMGAPAAQIQTVSLDWWTAVALWIAQPWATILLLALGLALVVIELLTWHSWGLAGIIGGVLVLTIFAAHITVGTATWVGVVLFLAGIALLLFETHVFPGHGLSAFAGLVLIFLGMFYALGGVQTGALYSAATALFVTLAIVVGFFLYLPHSRVWNTLGQPMRQTATAGYVSSDDYTGFLGRSGIAVTLLRPSGTAEIEGVRLPVVSEGEFVSEGAPVQVVAVQGSRIVVRATE